MFVDEITITARSGAGGRGCEGYLNRTDHKKIPNGGDGGDGGDVIVRSDQETGSLLDLNSVRIFEAENGGLGQGGERTGRQGKNCMIKVPCGTTLYQLPDRLLIRDLLRSGEEVLLLKGGQGGYGNHSGRPATQGKPGTELELLLSLKIIADIFLVGLPNAGNTALLKRLTGAHVAETDYPFATKTPQLGAYKSSVYDFRICDLPSVYGASGKGRGLGTRFLKHLERAQLLFLVLEPTSDFAKDLKEGRDILLNNIKNFNEAFLEIPRFWVVNKIDQQNKKTNFKKAFPAKEKVFPISALTGEGVDRLMKAAAKCLSEHSSCHLR